VTEDRHDITLVVNGVPRTATAPARRLLSDFLRHDLGLTGTHVGCEHGVCGCCTILVDGRAARSCLLFAVAMQGHHITTIEGLAADDGTLHPVHEAFHTSHALQCGFCTSGFVMSVCSLLDQHPDPSDDEVFEGIAGNLCRCTGYQNIVTAVHDAAGRLRDGDVAATGRARPAGEVAS